MNVLANRGRVKLPLGIYLDDLTTGGKSLGVTWGRTKMAAFRLVGGGFPLGVKKLQLMQRKLNVLGMELAGERYRLG